jgi:phospholipid transport system transporter-binding protein
VNDFVARRDGVLEVSGRMTFQTVPELAARSAQWFNASNPAVTVDLGKVTMADSAGLALMLDWMKQARAAKREIKFLNLPDQVRRLIRVSHLNSAFDLE